MKSSLKLFILLLNLLFCFSLTLNRKPKAQPNVCLHEDRRVDISTCGEDGPAVAGFTSTGLMTYFTNKCYACLDETIETYYELIECNPENSAVSYLSRPACGITFGGGLHQFATQESACQGSDVYMYF